MPPNDDSFSLQLGHHAKSAEFFKAIKAIGEHWGEGWVGVRIGVRLLVTIRAGVILDTAILDERASAIRVRSREVRVRLSRVKVTEDVCLIREQVPLAFQCWNALVVAVGLVRQRWSMAGS